jgi:adenylyltransferase/sulfurtransferase
MSIRILIPTAFRQHTDNKNEIEIKASIVRDALKGLVGEYPGLLNYLYSDGQRLRSFVNVYLNEEDIRYINGEETKVKDGDTLLIVPSIAGGSSPDLAPTSESRKRTR